MGVPPAEPRLQTGAPGRRRLPWTMLAVTLALALPTAWACGWFWTQSTPGQAALAAALSGDVRPDALTFDRLGWGPDPRDAWVAGLVIRGRDGDPAIVAERLVARLDGDALLARSVHLTSARARRFEVRLAWDAEGTFNLAGALGRRKVEPEPPEPEPEREPTRLVRLDGLQLEGGLVTLDWPAWGLRFEDVHAKGDVHLGGDVGLAIDADLEGAAASSHLDAGKRHVRFRALRIGGFVWGADGFRTEELRLTGQGDARVVLRGGMTFGAAAAVDATGDAHVGPAEVGDVLGTWLPEGVRIDGLSLAMADEVIQGSASRARAGIVQAGPLRLEGLDLPIERALVGPGSLTPRLGLKSTDARVARVLAPEGVTAEGVRIASFDATLDGRLDATLDKAAVTRLTLPQGAVSDATLDAKAAIAVSGGSVTGALASGSGKLSADATVDVSLLKRQASINVAARVEALSDTLAATLATALPPTARDVLGEPVTGSARFGGLLARQAGAEGGPKAWRLAFELASADLRGQGRVVFGDGGWKVAAASAESAP